MLATAKTGFHLTRHDAFRSRRCFSEYLLSQQGRARGSERRPTCPQCRTRLARHATNNTILPPIRLFLSSNIIPTSSPDRSSPPPLEYGADSDEEVSGEKVDRHNRQQDQNSSLIRELRRMKETLDEVRREKAEADLRLLGKQEEWQAELDIAKGEISDLESRLEGTEDEARRTQTRLEAELFKLQGDKRKEIKDLNGRLRRAAEEVEQCAASLSNRHHEREKD
jgi:hypothetical protein